MMRVCPQPQSGKLEEPLTKVAIDAEGTVPSSVVPVYGGSAAKQAWQAGST